MYHVVTLCYSIQLHACVVNRDKFLIREAQDEACRVCCKTRCLKKNLIQLYERARREISFTSV